MSTRVEIIERLGILIAAYPNTQVTGDTINVYVRMLEDVPVQVLDCAVKQSLAECKFFPSVAELREKVFALSSNVSQVPDGWAAWGQVVNEIHRTGFYGQPEFKSPLLARAVEIIGWRELCTSENSVADRAHFVKIYDQLKHRAEQDVKLLPASRELIQRSIEAPEAPAEMLKALASKLEM